nr:otopetrin-2-like isoform X1 [Leptinotarsa decemlineata]
MDTVQEEASPPPSPSLDANTLTFLLPPVPQIIVTNEERSRRNSCRTTSEQDVSQNNSRRPSSIIAALRRPSQVVALSAAHAVMNQRRYIMGLFNDHGDALASNEDVNDSESIKNSRMNQKVGDDALSKVLSALYGKLLVVLGIAFPVTEIISSEVQPFFYQGFYLYLYIGSLGFVAYLFAAPIRERVLLEILKLQSKSKIEPIKKPSEPLPKFGSFYLRVGAIAFGIGSMVYSGLEFGQYFEGRNNPACYSNIIQAITPAMRIVLTLVQVQFIFLNNKDFEYNKHRRLARFGFMHMIACNLCEWLHVLVEETKHEIIHLEEHSQNASRLTLSKKYCRGNVMGSLVTNSSPFLFPCTIEYSLICAVILFEMWKQVGDESKIINEKKNSRNLTSSTKAASQFHFNPFGGRVLSSNEHYTIDCSNAHKGLFAGIVIIVLTIISLIMFFVLTSSERSVTVAIFEVNTVELILYIATTFAVLIAMLKMRKFKYDRKIGHEGNRTGIGLDCTLLVVSQTGIFFYCMFSITGCYFTRSSFNDLEMVTEILAFIQTCFQTIFVLDGWWRKCSNIQQTKNKPGRELITFLIVANMAMWTMNTLEKNRAEFRPSHLEFFGEWAWTIITHISMPLVIFYRFHSTICLFEIWKTAYKFKAKLQTQFFPLI